MSRCTDWTVPGRGATLGELRQHFGIGPPDGADGRVTSLALLNDRIPDDEDRERACEVWRRAAEGEEL